MRATSRVLSARGGWPVRGSESSRCSLAAAGRALTQAAIAASASSSSGIGAGAPALAVADGHPPARRARDRLAQARVTRAAALVDVAHQQPARPRRGAARPSRAGAAARGRACPGGCGGRASAAAAPIRRARARVARRARHAPSGPSAAPGRRRARRPGRAAPTGAWRPWPASARALERIAVGAHRLGVTSSAVACGPTNAANERYTAA